MLETSDIVGHLIYIFFTLALLMQNMFYLRLFTILSGLCAIIHSLYLTFPPFWIPVYWETLFIILNIFQILLLIYERRKLTFTPEAQEVYEKVFPNLLPSQFQKLLKISTFAEAEKGGTLIQQGSPVPYLFLIYKGLASISIDGKIVNYCGFGDLLGEMSFLSEKPATATVQAIQTTKYIIWLQNDLRKLLESNPNMKSGMQTVFNNTFIAKLTTLHSEPIKNTDT